MPRYRIKVQGENVLIHMEDRLSKHGFITYRVVEAQDPEVAEEKAVQLVRNDARLRKGLRNDRSDPPKITADEVLRLENTAPADDVVPGFIWYESRPKRRR